jgi:hypothetical protein
MGHDLQANAAGHEVQQAGNGTDSGSLVGDWLMAGEFPRFALDIIDYMDINDYTRVT